LAAKAEQLANVRRSQRIRTQVVEIEDVYDEFSYGLHDGQAIKNFLQYATANWNGKPNYVLLFGDSSADSKGYLNGIQRDLVPTKLVDTNYMETASDSSLADFDGDDIEDIAIGRLPVATEAEADSMLAKLARFDAQTARQTLKNVMVADSEFGNLSDEIANRMPAGTTTVKLNRAEIGDANMHSQIVSNANDNPIVVSYFGHGNTSNWTNAGVFNKSDALGLTNQKLSFYLLMTCLNGYTHSPYSDSLAESLMRSNGGAIAVLASPNLNLPDGQQELRTSIYSLMFNVSGSGARALRFGSIIKAAKANTQDRDVRKSYLLIGDPTLVVK
jgi:Peptidase family C25